MRKLMTICGSLFSVGLIAAGIVGLIIGNGLHVPTVMVGIVGLAMIRDYES